jgi:hypothetical protein
VALLQRLNTDKSLSAFAGQFVPVKVVTNGSDPDWGKLARAYPSEGNGIPKLYVIRADGQMLYGKSGAPQGEALPQMLLTTLQQSGRSFSDADAALLATVVEQAKAALAEQDQFKAAKALGQLSKLGQLGDLQSHSESAKEADALVKQITEAAQTSIAEAKEKLGDADSAFDAVLTLVQAEAAYGSFPKIKADLTAAMREGKKNKSLDPAFKSAEALQRARIFAASENAAVKKKAPSAYELVITKFPGTPAEKLARDELAAIDPDAAALSSSSTESSTEEAGDDYRTWSDASGKFKIEAKFVQQKQGFVQLQKRDGKLVSIAIAKLSQADQDFLKEK